MATFFVDSGSFRDVQVTGSLTISQNLTVLGSSSITYITSSQLNIQNNLITVNTATPAIRFGGLAVIDSGSTGTGKTGSILWDSQNDVWLYSNPSGAAYDGAMLLVGPRNSTGIGNEQPITQNYLAKGDGSHHMTSSQIYNSGSLIRLETNTEVTGTLNVSQGITGKSSGSLLGSSINTATASILVQGPVSGGPYAALAMNPYGNTGVDIQAATNGGGTIGGIILLNRQSGNVAIGKATANSTLDVNGNTTVSGSFAVSGSGNFTGALTAASTVGVTGTLAASNLLDANAINLSTFASTGNGTFTYYYYTTNIATPINASKSLSINAGAVAPGNNNLWANITLGYAFGRSNSAYAPVIRAAIQTTNFTDTAGAESADLIFLTKPASPVNTAMTEKMRISSTGNVTITGNLSAPNTPTTGKMVAAIAGLSNLF